MATKWDQGISFILSFCYYDRFRLWRLKRIEPLSLTFSIFFILPSEMKESIITPKYAVLSSEEFWCHVLDPKTQGWIWEMGLQYRTFALLFVTAGILRAPSSDSYSWVSYGLCFAYMRTAPVTSELLSTSRYGIAHSHKPYYSLCAFKICSRHPSVTSIL